MIRLLLLIFLTLFSVAPQSQGQTAADSTAIRQTALDYIEGWYTGDAERMSRAVYSKLVKRIVAPHPKSGETVFRDQDSTALVAATEKGYGKKIPEAQRQKDITILDVFTRAPQKRLTDASYLRQFTGGYALRGRMLTVRLQGGDTLVLTIPGQPTYTLVPTTTNEFNVEGLSGYNVIFSVDEGTVVGMEVRQPNETYTATRTQ